MMAPKVRLSYLKILTLLIFVSLISATLYFTIGTQQNQYLYTFINETQNHQFDESIRVSIFAANKKTQTDHAIVILSSLPEGAEIETVASHLFKELHVGEKYRGRGVLYLFVPNENRLKIEVSYALEGVLPDVTLRLLEEAAKTYIFSNRYHDFWAELLITVNLQIGDRDESNSFEITDFKYLSGGGGRTSLSYSATSEQLKKELKALPPENPLYQKSSSNLEDAYQLYLQSLGEGIYDANLGILDFDSQVFRVKTPLTQSHLKRNYVMMTKAGVERFIEMPSLGFVFFKPGYPVLPVVFRKNERNQWQVQEPMSWSLFHRFEDSQQVFLKYPIQTKSEELKAFLQTTFKKPLYYFAQPVNIDELEKLPKEWMVNYFFLYDIESFRNNYNHLPIAIRLDLLTNLGLYSEFLNTYHELKNLYPADAEIKTNYEFYKKALSFDPQQWQQKLPSPLRR